jgi:hypothetical protein
MLAATGFYRWSKEAGKQFSFGPICRSLAQRNVKIQTIQ